MRIELDDVVRIGTVTIVALAQRSVCSQGSHGVSFHATKRPVAILIRHDDVTIAFEINGRQIAFDEFEEHFPGQRAEFERLTIGDSSDKASQSEAPMQ